MKNAVETIVDLHNFMNEYRVEITVQPDNSLRWTAYSITLMQGANGVSPSQALYNLYNQYHKQRSDAAHERNRDLFEGQWIQE